MSERNRRSAREMVFRQNATEQEFRSHITMGTLSGEILQKKHNDEWAKVTAKYAMEMKEFRERTKKEESERYLASFSALLKENKEYAEKTRKAQFQAKLLECINLNQKYFFIFIKRSVANSRPGTTQEYERSLFELNEWKFSASCPVCKKEFELDFSSHPDAGKEMAEIKMENPCACKTRTQLYILGDTILVSQII